MASDHSEIIIVKMPLITTETVLVIATWSPLTANLIIVKLSLLMAKMALIIISQLLDGLGYRFDTPRQSWS